MIIHDITPLQFNHYRIPSRHKANSICNCVLSALWFTAMWRYLLWFAALSGSGYSTEVLRLVLYLAIY
jgi:hypothetical protein